MLEINVLRPEELAERWNDIRPHIEIAIEHGVGETSSHDMFVGCMNGNYHCWEILIDGKPKNYGMTRFNNFQQHRQLQIVTCAGEDWDEYGPAVLAEVELVAKDYDCKYVTIWGRHGWQRKLKPLGYNHIYTVLMKEVDNASE